MQRRRSSRGSALVLVLVSAIVLSILVGALFVLFKSNVDTQRWAKERIQARFTAEAGLNMAVHMIMGGADVPQGELPMQMLPETGSWHDLGDGLGWVQVWVDPDNDNDQVSSANAYEVRCLAKVVSEDQDYYYGIASLIMPRNFAVYATFLNGAPGGYFGDGYRFDGPFHANSQVMLYSSTPGRDDDPWFYSFSTTEDFYLYGTSSGELAYEPHYKNLYMEPYERMLMGEPYFVLGAEEIPFGSDEVSWEGTYNAASSGGLVLNGLQDGTRMLLLEDTLLVKQSQFAPEERYYLGDLDNPVVWVNNMPTETVYLKTEEEYPPEEHGLPMGLTIGVNGTLAISGSILYNNTDLTDPDNNNMLGLLVVYGDFVIAHDPQDAIPEEPDWVDGSDERWCISTSDQNYERLKVYAVSMVLDGQFKLENVGTPDAWDKTEWPNDAIDYEMLGGYIVNEEYITTYEDIGTGETWGYLTFVTYDPRLMSSHPPYFPQTGKWDTAYWDERPEMTDDSEDENYIGADLI
ncbi:MAG: hypothetical protein R6U39_03920 [Candidatus Aegiribacteria sp.]